MFVNVLRAASSPRTQLTTGFRPETAPETWTTTGISREHGSSIPAKHTLGQRLASCIVIGPCSLRTPLGPEPLDLCFSLPASLMQHVRHVVCSSSCLCPKAKWGFAGCLVTRPFRVQHMIHPGPSSGSSTPRRSCFYTRNPYKSNVIEADKHSYSTPSHRPS